MTTQPRGALHRLATLLATGAAACALLAGAGAGAALAAESTIVYQKESLGQYENQLAAGQIQSVIINKTVRSLRVTLRDGQHVLAHYAPKQEPSYIAALRAKGVPVSILPTAATGEKKAKPVHHKLRYIAGGVLIVVVVIVGVVLYVNRRRSAIVDER